MNDLWAGAGVVLADGTHATVVHPGRYARPGTMYATTESLAEPHGVLVAIESGERIDVPRDELRLVTRDYPYRGEPDAAHAQWVIDALDDWTTARTVSAFVPKSYAAAVCFLHGEIPGRVPNDMMRALVDILDDATTTPDDVFFAVWEGWGGTPWERFPTAALARFTARGCKLLRGAVDGVLQPIDDMPGENLHPMVWWPADRAWVVHSEIDFPWTFVAGSDELAEAIVQDHTLCGFRVAFDRDADPSL